MLAKPFPRVSFSLQTEYRENFMSPIKLLTTSLLLLVISGCGGSTTGSVTGTVRVDGNPMGGFEVRYYSVADGSMAIGGALSDGQYKIVKGRGETAIEAGDYKVTVTPSSMIDGVAEPKVKIPRELADASTTTLMKTVGPGANVIDLEISAQK
ncbi:hypothetical protein [Lacunimicrobium album]